MRNLLLSLFVIGFVSTSCASFQPLRFANDAFTALNDVSTAADSAVTSGVMTRDQRQQFAANFMVPALTTLDRLIEIGKTYKKGQPIPPQVPTLIQQVANATDYVRRSLGQNSNLLEKLQTAGNKIAMFVGDFK